MRIPYLCPKCRNELTSDGKSLRCADGHVYDISADGYVNLTSGHLQGGDSKEMCRARRDFLAGDYYLPLAEALAQLLSSCGTAVDMGCGEGYYDRVIARECADLSIVGLDLSKETVRLASKAAKREGLSDRLSYAVAGIFDAPFDDESFDAAISVFAPVADAECRRVLRKNGRMIVVTPGEMHLDGLKSAVYERPYTNIEKMKSYDGFEISDIKRVRGEIEVAGANIENLFLMTPYYWKTSEKDAAKLTELEKLVTHYDFIMTVFAKRI